MFDAIIRDLGTKFGLGDKAGPLLGGLLALIFNPAQGGFAGFINKFRDAGLGDVVSSWIGGGAGARPIEPDRLAGVLGGGALGGLASKLGIAQPTVASGLAGVLPSVIGALTPGGQIPTGVPAAAAPLIAGFDNWTGRAAEAVRAAPGPGLGWLKWLIPLLVILLLGYCMLSRRHAATPEAVAPVPPTPATVATPPVVEKIAQDAAAAFAALKAGFTADDLVNALNLMDVHFDTDSANISADSQDILAKAADAIKRAPAGTRVEIGGHTDNTGDPAANKTLSDARANAVRTRLVELGVPDAMLTAKGYGSDNPVADNATEEGRAQNRRMHFTVIK